MNRYCYAVCAAVILAFGSSVYAEEASVQTDEILAKKSGSVVTKADRQLEDSIYSVETDSVSAADSLNRISGGSYETSRIGKEATYKSPNHYRAGPFGQQEAAERASGS
ncbi:MAG: hypothetical protein WCG06_02110 [Candidatus Omnitrophota bacterium]